MDATPLFASFRPCYLVILEMENRQIDGAICEEVPGYDRNVDLAHLGHAKHINIKPCGFLFVLARDRNMSELCHSALLCQRSRWFPGL
jgi:hypothetical protein